MKQNTPKPTPRAAATSKYSAARNYLLLMLILTLVNIILQFVGSSTLLLFSATLPYYAVMTGLYNGYPADITAGCVIAAVILGIFFLCWRLSAKHPGWMAAALVLFVLDTVCMFAFDQFLDEEGAILNIIIHVLILYYLLVGTISGFKLRKLPADPAPTAAEQ